MKWWKSRRKQATYSQLAARMSERRAIHEAEEIVGAAWMAGLLEAEAQAASRRLLDRLRDRHESLREFVEHERAAWVEAERRRALEVLADRDRLAEAARTAGAEDGVGDRKHLDA